MTAPQSTGQSIAPVTAREPLWFRASLIGAIALYVALLGVTVARTYEPLPTFDALDWIIIYLQRNPSSGWGSYLWDAHNVHRILFARLLVAIDAELFRGSGFPFLVSGALATVGIVAALLWECRAAALSGAARALTMVTAVLLFASAHLATPIAVPTFSPFLHAAFFVVLAIVLLNGARDSRHAALRLGLALLCAALAPFGLSGALLVWPTLVWLAWRSGHSSAVVLTVALLGAAEWMIYLRGVVSERLVADIGTVLTSADYAIQLLGLPWSRAAALAPLGRIIGGLVFVLGAGLLLRTNVQPGPTRLQRLGAALILFAFLVAGVAAFARSSITPELGVPIRYGIFAAMAQFGIVCAAAEDVPALLRAVNGSVLRIAAVAVMAGFLVQQIALGAAAAAASNRGGQDWQRFAAAPWTPEMSLTIHHTRERAELGRRLFRERGLYRLGPSPRQ